MDASSIERYVAVIEIFLSAALSTTSVLAYLRVHGWWRADVGRHMMAFMIVISAVLDLNVVSLLILPGGPFNFPVARPDWFASLRLGIFSLVPLVLGWRLWLIIKIGWLHRSTDPALLGQPADEVE